jgi:hypothetical protein
MNDLAVSRLDMRLQQIEARLAKRDAMVTQVYGSLCLAAVALFVLFPFPISRVGSFVLVVGFSYMVWRCKRAPARPPAADNSALPPLVDKLASLERQIEFAQTMLYNVPFFVGANLFWMGLPGTGTVLEKAVQDFVFLGGTLLLFAASYLFNQHLIRKELMPLREELQRLVRGWRSTQ